MPAISALHRVVSDLSNGDHSFEKFFEEVIASPELNLLDDVFAESGDIDQKPLIHTHAQTSHHLPPGMPHPILHRLAPVPPPPLSILKSHINPIPTPTTSSGGISPTLTWSGGPSPIDQSSSPTLNDVADLDGEEWKPSPSVPLFSSTSRRNSADRGREAAQPTTAPSSSSPQMGTGRQMSSRSRSSKRSISASSTSADGGDELTMSNLSIQNNGTTSLALISSPPSSTGPAQTPRASQSPTRKRTRTGSSSRSSFSSVDAILSEVMSPGASGASAGAHAKLIPTGHRRNITSASLVPLDAPTQIRNYLTPSSTSKKEIPSAFVARRNKLKAKEQAAPTGPSTSSGKPTRKRTREEAGLKIEPDDNDAVDQLQDDDTQPADSPTSPVASSSQAQAHSPQELANESASLLSAIEAKRRQNTLAARRSRQRKLDYVRNLEELVTALTRERNEWKSRAEVAEKHLGYRPAEDEMDEDDEE